MNWYFQNKKSEKWYSKFDWTQNEMNFFINFYLKMCLSCKWSHHHIWSMSAPMFVDFLINKTDDVIRSIKNLVERCWKWNKNSNNKKKRRISLTYSNWIVFMPIASCWSSDCFKLEIEAVRLWLQKMEKERTTNDQTDLHTYLHNNNFSSFNILLNKFRGTCTKSK